MGRCTKGTSQFVLLATNTLIFLVSAASLGVSVYIFYDAAAKSLSKVSLLTVVGIASLALMLFSIIGCKAAVTPPQKKCSKCLYLTILLFLFMAEFIAAGYVFNLGHALEAAKSKGFNLKGDVDKAAENALVFLHNQIKELYDDEQCQGGGASGAQIPFNFTAVKCKTKRVDDAFRAILQTDASITNQTLASYTNCTTDAKFTPSGSKPTDFTQAFCGSEANIVTLAHRYSRYIVWFPVALAVLTMLLLISTICLMGQKNQRRQVDVRLLQTGQEYPHRVQLAGP